MSDSVERIPATPGASDSPEPTPVAASASTSSNVATRVHNANEEKLQKQIMEIFQDKKLNNVEKNERIQKLYSYDKKNQNDDIVHPEIECKQCPHYDRNNLIQAKCCQKFYGCRLCHDEDESLDHKINRFETEVMQCLHCLTVQPVSSACINPDCDKFNETHYYCSVCKLWNDDEGKDIFHCDDCKICRIGKRENFFHCKKCRLCLANEQKKNHENCLDGAAEDDCPVCLNYMQDSQVGLTVLDCGHCMHHVCFKQYLQSGQYNCPFCKKICVDKDYYNNAMKEAIENHTMPIEYENWTAEILCNDCQAKSICKFHFYGHRCAVEECGSHNTTIINTIPKAPSK